MNASDWMDLTVLERKKYNYLTQVLDLSQQIGSTLDRNDSVSLKILVSLRQEPILALDELRQAIDLRRKALSAGDQARVNSILSGTPPKTKEETFFFQQASMARRELDRVLELDRRINLRMAGKNSFYRQ